MSILNFLSGLISPVTTLIDELHVSEEEKLKLRNELAGIEKDVATRMMQLQEKTLEASAKVAVAETKSDSWFTRTYRPAIITGMFILLCVNAFGLLPVPLPEIFTAIFGSAFGVVGIGRSVEKVFKTKRN